MKALQKLLILGSGKMGSSLLKGLISNNELNFDISVVEPNLTKDNNDLILERLFSLTSDLEYFAVMVVLASIFLNKLILSLGQITSMLSTLVSFPNPKKRPGSTDEK